MIYKTNHLNKNNRSAINGKEIGYFPYSKIEVKKEDKQIKIIEKASIDNKNWTILVEKNVR